MANDNDKMITITDPGEDRYASLRLIDWWDQDRIRGAHIMVVGAGALGNEVLKNLALLGVGHLFIVDFDFIEASNLTRSVLFRTKDGGKPKATTAAERVKEINEDIQVIALHGDVTRELGIGVYRRMDVIIGCLDNRAARLAVNRACWNINRPWIDGALDAVNGLVRVFAPPDGACYECTFTEQDYQLMQTRYSCAPGFTVVAGRQPTMPTTASIIAAMQVQEAMKLLHGQETQSGRAVYYSWQALRLSSMAYALRHDCPAHLLYDPIISLSSGSNHLTLAQFAEHIRHYMQEDGVLFLPQEVATWLYCAICEQKEIVYRPQLDVIPDSLPCPVCGNSRAFDITGTLATAHMKEDISLEQLGIPPLHILPVRTRIGWQYFELSADEQRLLHFR
jgi:adenylyltransferase/sulfurtransferase